MSIIEPRFIIKQGYMVKRSQNKKIYTLVNFKKRWFVLTRRFLIYYDDENEAKRKEKGRVELERVHTVEAAQHLFSNEEVGVEGEFFPFLVGYHQDEDYTLFLLALRDVDRIYWILAIRNVCAHNRNVRSYFHPAPWNGRKWSCCKNNTKLTDGCRECDSWIPSQESSPSKDDSIAESLSNKENYNILGARRPPYHHHHQSSVGRPPPCLMATARRRDSDSTVADDVYEAGGDFQLFSVVSKLGKSVKMQFETLVNVFRSATGTGAQSSPIMPGGGTPGTPSAKQKDKQPATPRTKVVVALYNYKAIETGDLSLEKNMEYEVIDDSQEHWWKVRDSKGLIGFIPSNYVKEKELLGLQQYDWYVNDMSRQRSESLLKHEDKEGCFVVRNSSTKGLYTLSLYTKIPHPHVKHYHIKKNGRAEFFLSEKHCCSSIPELINYHKHNSGGLASRLKTSPCDRPAPATAGLSHDKWEIDHNELMLHEELGSGQFGVVRRGKWRGTTDVAVKMMKEGTMSEDDFIEEAKVMTKLQHANLVQLYGVCSKNRPIFIVTEYMRHGSLLNYLRRNEQSLCTNQGLLLDMCIQVCKGMAYLERHNYIHRDLAARNCLVGNENIVKVADFGLARYVLDDQYTSSGGSKFPIKWAPPEVLNYTRFSSKSDVWAYGVLMWEVFTCGKMPYGRMKNSEVVERVQKGIILDKPKACFKEVYDVMKKCWAPQPENRPSFRVLKDTLINVSQGILVD